MSCVGGPAWHFVVALLAIPAALIAHELAHLVMMYPVAERIHVQTDSWQAALVGDMSIISTHEPGVWRDRWADAAGFAPIIFGTLLVAGMWAGGVLPGVGNTLELGFWNAWAWMVLVGSITDYSRAASMGQADPWADAGLVTDGGPATGLMSRFSVEKQQAIAEHQQTIDIAMYSAIGLAIILMFVGGCSGMVAEVASVAAVFVGVVFLAAVSRLTFLLGTSHKTAE